ncbi:hypothetical protein BH20ACT23_BH20ACT23_14660 [soil metagenome]
MWVSERGQTAPEYVGILAFVVAIVLLVVAAGPGIGGSLVERILCIVTGDCSDGPDVADPDDAFRPDDCDVYTRSTSDNGTVKVAVFTVGADYGFTRTEKSTGETEITFVDLGELGLEAGVGAKFKVNDAGADVSADIKAQLGLSNGDTWVFDSPEEADEFEGWLRREKNEDRISSFSPVFGIANGIYEWASGEEDIPDPRKSYWEVNESVEGSASGHIATAGGGLEGGAALAIGGMNDRGEDLDDPSDDTSTEYFSVNFDAAFDVGLLTVDAGAGYSGEGVMKLKRDASGEIVELEIVDTSEGSLSGLTADLDAGRLTWGLFMEKLQDLESLNVASDDSDTNTVVSTTKLDLTNPTDRAVAEEWFMGMGGFGGAVENASPFGGVDAADGNAGDAFSQLLYDHGRVSVVEYDGQKSGLDIAAEVALGLKLGGAIGTSETDATAIEALFLDSPEDGERTLIPFTECVGG